MVNFTAVSSVEKSETNRYVEELKSFMQMKVKLVKTDYNSNTSGGLRQAVKKSGLPIICFSRAKVIYLQRTDMQ